MDYLPKYLSPGNPDCLCQEGKNCYNWGANAIYGFLSIALSMGMLVLLHLFIFHYCGNSKIWFPCNPTNEIIHYILFPLIIIIASSSIVLGTIITIVAGVNVRNYLGKFCQKEESQMEESERSDTQWLSVVFISKKKLV